MRSLAHSTQMTRSTLTQIFPLHATLASTATTMSESTNSDGTTCPTLTGPNNYEIWKLWSTVKLRREKVLGIVLGTDAKPGAVPGSTTSATGATVSTIVAPDPEDVRKWTE